MTLPNANNCSNPKCHSPFIFYDLDVRLSLTNHSLISDIRILQQNNFQRNGKTTIKENNPKDFIWKSSNSVLNSYFWFSFNTVNKLHIIEGLFPHWVLTDMRLKWKLEQMKRTSFSKLKNKIRSFFYFYYVIW